MTGTRVDMITDADIQNNIRGRGEIWKQASVAFLDRRCCNAKDKATATNLERQALPGSQSYRQIHTGTQTDTHVTRTLIHSEDLYSASSRGLHRGGSEFRHHAEAPLTILVPFISRRLRVQRALNGQHSDAAVPYATYDARAKTYREFAFRWEISN